MFQRIITGNPEAVCTVLAFVFAATIFVSAAWRGVRMKSSQSDRLSRLPFDTATPASPSHDRSEENPPR